jgi:hypothetical protein
MDECKSLFDEIDVTILGQLKTLSCRSMEFQYPIDFYCLKVLNAYDDGIVRMRGKTTELSP